MTTTTEIAATEITMAIIQDHKDMDFLTDVISLWFKVQRDTFHFENMNSFEEVKASIVKLMQTYMVMTLKERQAYYQEFRHIYSELNSILYIYSGLNSNSYTSTSTSIKHEEEKHEEEKQKEQEDKPWFDTNVWGIEDGKWWDEVWKDFNENSEEKIVWNQKSY